MIVFDLDGTLTDCEHRRHFVHKPLCGCVGILSGDGHLGNCPVAKWKPNWHAFHAACLEDRPRRPVVMALVTLMCHHRCEIWSGRNEQYRGLTEQWLRRWAPAALACNLRMRPDGDYRPDEQLKGGWLEEEQRAGGRVELVFDDRNKMVAFWRSKGIVCAQVAEGAF